MITKTCDECEVEISGEGIILSGYKDISDGGILLPASFTTKHFCDRECFVTWCENEVADYIEKIGKGKS